MRSIGRRGRHRRKGCFKSNKGFHGKWWRVYSSRGGPFAEPSSRLRAVRKLLYDGSRATTPGYSRRNGTERRLRQPRNGHGEVHSREILSMDAKTSTSLPEFYRCQPEHVPDGPRRRSAKTSTLDERVFKRCYNVELRLYELHDDRRCWEITATCSGKKVSGSLRGYMFFAALQLLQTCVCSFIASHFSSSFPSFIYTWDFFLWLLGDLSL